MVQALKTFPRMAKLFRGVTGRILHKADTHVRKITIGSDYGSHTIPEGLLKPSSIVYSFGIGTDVSFDLGVIERYGCSVHAFDPTPRSVAWMAQQKFDTRLAFHGIGLGEEDGNFPFQQPEKDTHVSFSRSASNSDGVLLPVKRLATIMRELGHSRIDVFKLDIEGFEYGALRDMLSSGIFPTVIAVEFHHRMYEFSERDTNEAVRALLDAGYGLFHVSDTGREYSFILKS